MNEIIDILNSNFKIASITINNFSLLDDDVSIDINIIIEKETYKKIIFSTVSNIYINQSYHMCAFNLSSIIIVDMQEMQLENVFYEVMISEDVMTFYCKEIKIE